MSNAISIRFLGLLSTMLACLGAAAGRADTSPDGLVLITTDSLRADYLGANGSARGVTPHLDRIAADGVSFMRARSPVPMSLPAHASILTATYPPVHSLRGDGVSGLPDTQVTLAEMLQRHGYRSIAIVASPALDRRFGLDQGFEVYDDQIGLEPHRIPDLYTRRSGKEVVAAFRSWLRVVESKQRFFAWINLTVAPAGPEAIDLASHEYRSRVYAQSVGAVDARVGEVVAELRAQGRLERTVVAVVGAHGESLGEMGELGHSLLIQPSALHVPMVIRAPRWIVAGRSVPELVRTIDLAPTLLDLFGIEESIGEGVSLRSLLDRDPPGQTWCELSAYSESLFGYYHMGAAPLYGLETANYRLVSGLSSQLFLVDEQNRETEAVSGDMADVIEEMDGRLLSIPGEVEGEAIGSDRSVDPRELVTAWRQFQSGIEALEGGDLDAAVVHFTAVLEQAPRASIALEYVGTALAARAEGEEAVRRLRQGLAAGVDSAGIRVALGRIELQLDRPEAAVSELEKALAIDSRDAEARLLLGIAYRRSDRDEAAIEQLRRAVQIEPAYLYAWSELGRSLAANGLEGEALRAYRRAVDVAAADPKARFELAIQLERMGRGAEAIEAYRKFLELAVDPSFNDDRKRAQKAIERLGS